MTTHTQYRVIKGCPIALDIDNIPGILGVYPNPHGEGESIVEIIHDRNPDVLPTVVKDQTVGRVILEPIE